MLLILGIFASGNFNVNQMLLKELYKSGDEYGIISPYSLITAMQMVRLGSLGKTQEELDLLLNGVSIFDIKDKGVSTANSFWFQKELKVKEDYQQNLKKIFNASIFYLEEKNSKDQAKKINKWVADNTKNKITEIVTSRDMDGIKMVLLNSIYFKGSWTNSFDKKKTEDAPFYSNIGDSNKVAYMYKKDMFRYFENDKFQFIAIPYKENTVLYVALPRETVFKNSIDILSEKYFLDIVARSKSMEVILHLPKIDLDFKIDAINLFQRLGIKQAFTGEADFSKIADSGVFISKILHRTKVAWDEEGTEAAAVTFVGMPNSIPEPTKPVTMNINRPFLFYITTKDAKEVLFSGYIQKL